MERDDGDITDFRFDGDATDDLLRGIFLLLTDDGLFECDEIDKRDVLCVSISETSQNLTFIIISALCY